MLSDIPGSPPPASILVDPVPLARHGLRCMIDECGLPLNFLEASSAELAQKLMRRHGAGIAILCHRPPRFDAIALLQDMRAEGTGFRIAILGSDLGPRRILEALRLDVDGLLPEDVTAGQLCECVSAMSAQARWLSLDVLREVVECETESVPPLLAGLDGLTPRQGEIVDLVAEGLSNKAIARAMGLAEGTVKLQLHRIYQRTGYRNRALLAAAVSLSKVSAKTKADTSPASGLKPTG